VVGHETNRLALWEARTMGVPERVVHGQSETLGTGFTIDANFPGTAVHPIRRAHVIFF